MINIVDLLLRETFLQALLPGYYMETSLLVWRDWYPPL